MINKKNLITGLASMLLLAACNLGGGDTQTTTETETETTQLPDVIKIGVIAPLTGGAAAYGQDVKSGVELYFSENPKIADKEVKLIIEDGKCNGQDAANAAQKLVNVDKVQFILGGQCSGETLAAAPIAEQNKVLLLSSLSSSPDVTTAGEYVFRNYPSDAQVVVTMMKDVLANHETVALLSEQTDYAQAYRQSIKEYLSNEEKEVVLDETFAVDNTDFRTLLAKVDKTDADVLIAIPQSPVVGGFIAKQMKELGMELQIYGGDTLFGPDFFDTAKDAAEGVRAVLVAKDDTREGYSEFTKKLESKVQFSELFAAFGYDAAAITAMAIAEVGYDATAVKDYFNTMGVYQGIASQIDFDENGDNDVPAAVLVAKDGQFVLVTE